MAAGNHDADVTSALAGNLLQYCSNRLGNMKLDLKRLFARSMTGGFELAGAPAQPAPSSARSARRQTMFVMLAGILAIVGAVAGAYYFAMRPVTLRIAVGPANSDDLKVVQALTQAFAQKHSHVRLRPIQTDGAAESAKALENGRVDLAIIRGDLDVPKNAQAVATLRKNVAVLWVPPPAKGKGRKSGPKITKISQLAGRKVGVVGRTPANVNLLKVILQQYGVDPAKVEIVQFPACEAVDAIRNQKADAYLAAGPVNSKITADAINASTRDGGTPTFLGIDSAEAIAQNHPMYEASEIPAGAFGGSPDRPDDEVKTISFSHHIVARKGLSESDDRRLHPAIVCGPAAADGGIPAGRENRDPGYRQGRRDPGASGCGGLCRRRGKDLPRPLQRLHLVGPDGAVGDGLGRCMVRGLPEEGRAQQQHVICANGCWTCSRRRAAAIPPRNSTGCRPRPTTSCAIRCIASTMARSRKGR